MAEGTGQFLGQIMYESHFSFTYKPFELVPNPDFIFLSSTHRKAITYLDYGIKEKAGFILLTGEVGSGKTTIIRNLIKNAAGSMRISRVNNTRVSSEELIALINEDFGLETEGKTRARLLSDLNTFLIEQYAENIHPILLIDEAQNLSAELLEEIRLLSNLETDRLKLLQIILVGQPELKKTLMRPELRQLRQRININYHIASLSVDETGEYIKHRLTVAGNPDAIRLDDEVLRIIYQFSRGIPRLINILCDFVLLAAFVEGAATAAADTVREVARDLESHDYWNEAEDVQNPGHEKSGLRTDLSEEISHISRRLLRLEEMQEEKGSDSDSELKEQLGTLDKKLAEMINGYKELNAGSAASQAGGAADSEGGPPGGDDVYDSLAAQVDHIRGLLGDINEKLKRL